MKRGVSIGEIPPTRWGCKPITGYIPSLVTRVIVVVVVIIVVVIIVNIGVVVEYYYFFINIIVGTSHPPRVALPRAACII